MAWEFKDLQIPLLVKAKVFGMRRSGVLDIDPSDEAQINAKVLSALQTAGSEGWLTDEATDYPSLYVHGCLRSRHVSASFFHSWTMFELATVRLRRDSAVASNEVNLTKRCPDCGEDVRAEARICRFCRYEFG